MEDIAVVGIGLRFPGQATSPEKLWQVLERAESQWSEFPQDRLNIDGYFHPSGDRQGSISFRGAHFLQGDIAAFDSPFFSIAAEDAKAIDPQQRLLLEVSYEALENAGLRKENLDGSDTSVYVGSFVKDYEQICLRDPDAQPLYAATGNGIAIMANRISHFFNFHGPSMTIDTGCSGSLVSVHLAAQSLRARESSLAIAAGCGMILTPNTIMPMTALNFLSPDGRCFTFDARANGYGRGEGIGVLVLKRLSDALRDNDTIRAVIRGSAVNQDGRTPGITLPSKEAQVANIRAVYANAGLDFDQTAYVECHGTGTQAGDWRELKAVSETLGSVRPVDRPIVVGSVKPNIGHLEGAAGVAGIIKSILILEHAKIPPNINFESGNPTIDFEQWRVKVPRSIMQWPLEGVRRVSVNCFGFGGTNAHVILDEAPAYLSARGLAGQHTSFDQAAENCCRVGPPVQESPHPALQLFCYSSHEKSGVLRVAKSHIDFLRAKQRPCSAAYLRDYAYTLNCRRSNMEWRAFVVAKSLSDLVNETERLSPKAVVRSSRDNKPRIGFIFCGQGSQWAQMGKDLLIFDAFRLSLEEASHYMAQVLRSSFDLLTEILKGEEDTSISQAHISQPATTAIQVALVDLLGSFGIVPQHVVGHSSGEIAAAYAAGALSKQQAWKSAYHRGLAASSIRLRAPKLKGGMMVVGMSEEETEAYLEATSQSAQVACINSPRSITISGQSDAMDFIYEDLRSKRVFCRRLDVNVAYHSSHMKLVEHDYRDSLAGIAAHSCSPSVRMFSSVTGKAVDGSELDASYWATNMVSPVRYVAAISAMMQLPVEEKPNCIIEVSPRPSLRSPTLDILAAIASNAPPPHHSILDPKVDSAASLMKLAGELWSQGYSVDMERVVGQGFQQPRPKCLSDLPPYPWNHDRSYWHESHLSLANRFRKYGRQDLIGAPSADAMPFEPRWRGFLRVSENPWIQDHQVQKTIVYPAAGMVSMALEGARQMRRDVDGDILGYEITNMEIEKAMIIPNTAHGLEVALNAKICRGGPAESGRKAETVEFSIYSKPLGRDWERNARGGFHFRTRDDGWSALFESHDARLETLDESCPEKLNPRQLYEFLDTVGMNYGPLFQNITEVRKGGNACVSRVRVPDTKSKMPAKFEFPHLMHPATLDSMIQTLFAIDASPMVPTFIKSIFVSANVDDADPSPFSGYAVAERTGIRDAEATVVMKRPGPGAARVIISGLHLTGLSTLPPAEGGFLPNHRNLCTEIVWKQDAAFATPATYDELVALLAHKHPALAVLQVGGGLLTTQTTLRALAPEPLDTVRLSRYTLVDGPGNETALQIASHLEGLQFGPFVEVKQNSSELSASYHLIVVFEDVDINAEKYKKHLKHGGMLVWCPAASANHVKTNGEARAEGSSSTRAPTPSDVVKGPLGSMNVFRSLSAAASGRSRDVVILLPETPNEDATIFVDEVKQAASEGDVGMSVSSISIGEIQDKATPLTGKIVVSLLDFAQSDAGGCSVFGWTEAEFTAFDVVQKAAKGLVWMTRNAHRKPRNPKGAPIIALARTLMSEDPLKMIVTFDLGCDSRLRDRSITRTILPVIKRTFEKRSGSEPPETEYAEERGEIYVPRLVTVPSLNRLIEDDDHRDGFILKTYSRQQAAGHPNQTGIELKIAHPGISDSSFYFSDFEHPELGPDEVEIEVERASLTHLDVETVLGRNTESAVGMDVVGYVKQVGSKVAGIHLDDRVAALVCGGAVRSTVRVKARLVTRSELWTMPSLYVSAYHGLVSVGRAGRGRKVLVQAGASSHGLVAIQMARWIGAEVFATVLGPESARQRQMLLQCGLDAGNILDANSDGFVKALQAATDGKGVDVVYNPTLEHVDASFECVRRCGVVVQFASKSPLPRPLPMTGGSVTVVNLDLCQLLRDDEELVAELVERVGQHAADLPPETRLPAEAEREFGVDKAQDALRCIQQAPYLGHVTLTSGGRAVPVASSRPIKPLSEAVDAKATYLLAGGLGGLGRSVSELLVSNGARHLAYLSRSGASSEAARSFMDGLRARGVDARAYRADLCDEAGLRQAMERLRAEMPPVRGVFQCAAVIKDAVFDNMTYRDWNAAIRPKTVGSLNLVEAVLGSGSGSSSSSSSSSSSDGPVVNGDKAFFVFLASSAGVIGNRGQANYAAGNCFEDALAASLRLQGRQAVSIDLGPVLGAGMLAEDGEILTMLRASGFYGIRHGDFLRVVEHAITGETVPGTATPGQVVLGVGTGGIIRQNQPADPYWSRTALYRFLNLVDVPPPDLGGAAPAAAAAAGDLRALLAGCDDEPAAADVVRAGLVTMLAKAMTMLPEELDAARPPNAYGVDSLVAVGVRNFVLSSFGVQVSVFDVLSDATIAELALAIARKGGYGAAAPSG